MTIAIVIAIVVVVLVTTAFRVTRTARRRKSTTGTIEDGGTRGATATRAPGAPQKDVVDTPSADVIEVSKVDEQTPIVEQPLERTAERPSLRDRLGKTREQFGASLGRIRGRAKFDATSFDELEEALILADVGLPTTQKLLEGLREKVRTQAIEPNPEALFHELEEEIVGLFGDEDRSLHLAERSPAVWIFVGVNGVGKTTTIGKVAAQQLASGRSVVLAAGDTFRAAAGEQLETWAERSGAGIIRGADGADPSSVVFDAISHAAARGADLVLADSAGRLHNKVNLMEELKKIRRIADRPPGEVAEVLLVLDATTGQNGLVQAREFAEAVALTGVVLTKLDGSAKGGIVLAIRSELGLPIKLVGVGEKVDDLVAFDPKEFAAALLS